jgi:formate dehydrogenase gamma subunit
MGLSRLVVFGSVIVIFGGTSCLGASDDCLSCHGASTGLTNSQGKAITVKAEAFAHSVHKDLRCVDCHAGAAKLPHTAKSASASCLACHGEVAGELAASAHSALGKPDSSESCIACHGDAHEVVDPATRGAGFCASCHAGEVKEFASSVHGRARGRGDDDAPSCADCHGATHKVVEASATDSPVNRQNLPSTCGRCHSDPKLAQKYLLAAARPVEAYEASVHARAIREGKKAAVCNDCHGTHAILSASDPRSPISKHNVSSTCGTCHERAFAQYKDSIHGRAVAAGVTEAPTCSDCHGEHNILAPGNPLSPVYVTNIATATCSRCHGDTRLDARFNLPRDRVTSYENSYHGLASRAGSQTVANCASCHGVHDILPSTDPRSTIAKANLAATCGKCHPDAGHTFALGPVHVIPAATAANPWLRYVRLFYLFTIPVTLGFMLCHNLLDWLRKLRRHIAKYRSLHTPLRLTLNERIQHGILLVSFVLLVITGFALRFPNSFWAAPIVRWEKDFPLRGLVHRIAGVVLIGAGFYHLIYLLFTVEGRKDLHAMLPRFRDAREAVQTVGYNLGYRRELPLYGKFNYSEKIEYWALVWGTVVMGGTGILLWAHNYVLRFLSNPWLDVLTAIHYYEAILATLAIVVWHLYAVIFDPEVYPLKWTLVNGHAPEHEVREEEEAAAEAAASKAASRKPPSPTAPASEPGINIPSTSAPGSNRVN